MWLHRGSFRYPVPRVQSGQHPLGPERNWISGPGYPSLGSIWSTPAGAEGGWISSLHTYPSVQSGQHPLAPKGDRYAVLEVSHVSGSVIRCVASQGILQISSPSGSIWSPSPEGFNWILDTRPLVQSGYPVRGFNRISSLHIRPLVQSGLPVLGFNRIFSPERITRVPPSLGSIWSPSPRVQSGLQPWKDHPGTPVLGSTWLPSPRVQLDVSV